MINNYMIKDIDAKTTYYCGGNTVQDVKDFIIAKNLTGNYDIFKCEGSFIQKL